MTELVIHGGRVIDPTQHLDAKLTVIIRDGKIAALRDGLPPKRAGEVIDATGAIVTPGFIDLHVHLREPGYEYKEDIASGAAAAAAGGFTTVCCMPNTNPINDSAAVTEFIVARSCAAGLVNVLPIGAVSRGQQGEELADIGDMARAGVIAISDDGQPVMSAGLMRHALEYASAFGLPVIGHEEDRTLSAGGVMHEGVVATELGLQGIPDLAEDVMVARDLFLAELTGAHFHAAHVSSRRSIDLIRAAKKRRIPVTAEVTPHHLLLTHEAVRGYDPNTKMNPPLRTDQDRAALIRALNDGTVDAIVTDHAPHGIVDKEVGFELASFGIVGLETALPLCLKLVHEKKLGLKRMIELFTAGPARVFKLRRKGNLKVGSDADVTIFHPTQAVTIDANRFRSKGRNTPFHGWRLKGKVRATIVGGRVIFDGTQAG